MSDQATIDRATSEFYAAKKAARAIRRAFVASGLTAFVRVMQSAISQYLQARTEGVSREDGINGLEMELRAAWPKSVSKFAPACGSCDDTGWTEHTCWERHRCGRKVCSDNPERQHQFVEPCGCATGERMRKRVQTTDDGIAAAGRMAKKRGGFSRMGR